MIIFDKRSLAGVDIGSYAVKVVKLKGMKTAKALEAIAYSRLENVVLPGDNLKLSQMLRDLFSVYRIRSRKVITVLSGNVLTMVHLYLPGMPDKDMKEAVYWEMRKQVTFPADELVCDYIVIGEVTKGDENVVSIIAFGARKKDVEGLINIFESASIEASIVDVTPIAMLAAFNYNNEWEEGMNYSMIDIGDSKSTLAIFRDRKLMFSREVYIAGRELTGVVMEKLACSEEVAEKEKIRCGLSCTGEGDAAVSSAMSGIMERLVTEVNRSLDYYQVQFRQGRINKVFLCGGTSKLRGIDDFFAKSLDIPCFVDDPLRNIKIRHKDFESIRIKEYAPDMTIAVGLAL